MQDPTHPSVGRRRCSDVGPSDVGGRRPNVDALCTFILESRVNESVWTLLFQLNVHMGNVSSSRLVTGRASLGSQDFTLCPRNARRFDDDDENSGRSGGYNPRREM